MTQAANPTPSPPSTNERTQTAPKMWGLGAHELHQAYWNTRGVQPVVRGDHGKVPRDAELYLLIEPDQLVIFDIRPIIKRMTWNNAMVTRVRILREGQTRYREHVITDEDGYVDRIERYYRADSLATNRAFVTRSRRIARIWSEASRRAEAWREVRRIAPKYQNVRARLTGDTFDARNIDDHHRLLDTLVTKLVDPSRAIEGIDELVEGVWGRIGIVLPPDLIAIGPIWLGDYHHATGDVVVGPKVFADAEPASRDAANARPVKLKPATIRKISHIQPHRPASAPDDHDIQVLPESRFSLKRLFDIVVSGSVLLVFSPLLIIIAIAIIWTDGWPVFFGHLRQTKGGRQFYCWKFRTMYQNAESMVADLADDNVCDGPQVFIENDPRVTKVGAFLRKYHLDELPQFINVLRGDMSIVGPRPSPDKENQICPAWREMRLSVRPGITGLWQVQRTREPGKDFQEWIRYDMEYVRRQSFWFDLKIIFKTASNIVFSRSNDGADDSNG